MDAMTTIVLLAMAGALITGALFRTVGLRSFRRLLILDGPQPLGRMMRQTGLSPDDAAGREYDLAIAATRCASCASAAQCSTLLDSGRAHEVRDFCPNSEFLREMAATKAQHAICVCRRFA